YKDGSLHWNLSRGVAIRDPNGRPIRFTGTSVNITRLKQAEEDARVAAEQILAEITERKALESAIQNARTRLELAMRGSDVAVYQADFPDGTLENTTWTFFNMWEPLGFDAAGMPASFVQLLPLAVHPEDQPAVVAQFTAQAQSRSPD